MGRYQIAVVARPDDWTPECSDDVPLELEGPIGILDESDDLFAAVRRASEYNESDVAIKKCRWAVVVEPGSIGRIWPAARLCTPLTFKVTSIWWPEGWEPNSPLDVPNCIWQSPGKVAGHWQTYAEAENAVRDLNEKCITAPGAIWYVVVAVENEAISQTTSYDHAGTETSVEVRKMHVMRPPEGGHGDCTQCPAHDFSCAKTDWTSQQQTMTARRVRSFGE